MTQSGRLSYVAAVLAGLALAHPLSVLLERARRRLLAPPTHTDDDAAAVQKVLDAFPGKATADPDKLLQYSTNWGSLSPNVPASVIVLAEDTDDVRRAVKLASQLDFFVIPIAGRTGLEGQFLPPTCCSSSSPGLVTGATPQLKLRKRTIHLSVERMKNIKLFEGDQQAEVGPGVGWVELNEHLASKGINLFFPVDPGIGALFGGMVAVAGSGTRAVGYGTMRADWVMNLEVVLADGSVMRTRGNSRSKKTSAGWDTARLFLGSEGTLGVITSIVIKLAPVLPSRVALTSFPTVQDATAAVIDILSAGLEPKCLEMLDGMSIKSVNMAKILNRQLREEPTVLLRLSHAMPQVLQASLERVASIVEKHHAQPLEIAKDEEENEEIWKARKSLFWTQQLLVGPDCQVLITDVCVPITRLAEFVDESEVLVRESALIAPIVAHIGDGNVHRAILFSKSTVVDGCAPANVTKLAEDLSLLAIRLEGTSAGEHGVGTTKRKYLERELGKETLDVMRKVKNALDPAGLFNPGKILYEDDEEGRGCV